MIAATAALDTKALADTYGNYVVSSAIYAPFLRQVCGSRVVQSSKTLRLFAAQMILGR